MYIYIYTHTHIHTYIHTHIYIDVYIYTYIYIYRSISIYILYLDRYIWSAPACRRRHCIPCRRWPHIYIYIYPYISVYKLYVQTYDQHLLAAVGIAERVEDGLIYIYVYIYTIKTYRHMMSTCLPPSALQSV